MSSFDRAIQIVFMHEGGYVNRHDDRGGPTNMGITQGSLAMFYNRPVSIDEVKNMTQDLAKQIYKTRYWDHMKLDQISSQRIATILLDLGVLRGTPKITKVVQSVLNLDSGEIMGPETISKINLSGEIRLGLSIIEDSQLSFCLDAILHNEQLNFLTGWITRTHSLMDFLLFSS